MPPVIAKLQPCSLRCTVSVAKQPLCAPCYCKAPTMLTTLHSFPPDISTARHWLDISSISISHVHANKQQYGEALNDLISGAPLLTSSGFLGATANKNKLFLNICMCLCVCLLVCVCVCFCVSSFEISNEPAIREIEFRDSNANARRLHLAE